MGRGASGPAPGINLENLTLDCNGGLAGCIPLLNWFAQENSGANNVGLHGFSNIGFDRENSTQNSGPFQNLVITSGSACTASTLCIVDRGSGQSGRGIQYATISQSSCATAPNVAIDFDNPEDRLQDIHFEHFITAIEVNASIDCPVACVDTHHGMSGGHISDIDAGGGSGTTVVDISTANGTPSNIVLESITRAGTWTNVLIDHQNSCTNTDSSLGMYVLDRAAAKKLSTGPC
jgi:hypothetical protein